MRRARVTVLAALAGVVALSAAAFLVPLTAFRGAFETAASRALDREVRIGGSMHLALFPQAGIALKDVSVANTAGAHDPQMIAVGKLVVGAELLPLLSGQLHLTKLVLKQPVIHLEVDRNGVGNWQPAAAGAPPNPPAAVSLDLQRIKIEGGQVIYFDARSGKSETLDAVSLSLTRADPSGGTRELTLDGAATYRASTVAFNSKLADASAFLKGQPSDAVFNLSSDLFSAGFTGRLQAAGSVTGDLKLKARSLRELAAWLERPLPPGNGLGAITINATFTGSQMAASFTKAAVSLDGMTLTGDFSLDTNAQVPTIKGTLAVDHLNLAPYMAPSSGKDAKSAATSVSRDTPLALGGLKGIDGDLILTAGAISLPDIRIDRAVVDAALHGGVLKANLTSLAAYGGSGKGTLTVDATGPVPAIHTTLDMSGVRTERFLGELMAIAKVSAAGSVHLDMSSHGRSEAEFIKDLDGKGSINFANGTISGVDLGAVAHLLQSTASLLGGAVADAAKTQFSSLSSSFTIQNGVFRTTDLRMVGPTIQMTGSGTVNLVNRQLDFHLNPQANLGVAGVKLADFGIPFYVRGTLDNPSFAPDAAGIPNAVAGTVGNTATKILNVPGDALKSLLGGR
jgi:AsmA protein